MDFLLSLSSTIVVFLTYFLPPLAYRPKTCIGPKYERALLYSILGLFLPVIDMKPKILLNCFTPVIPGSANRAYTCWSNLMRSLSTAIFSFQRGQANGVYVVQESNQCIAQCISGIVL